MMIDFAAVAAATRVTLPRVQLLARGVYLLMPMGRVSLGRIRSRLY